MKQTCFICNGKATSEWLNRPVCARCESSLHNVDPAELSDIVPIVGVETTDDAIRDLIGLPPDDDDEPEGKLTAGFVV